ncbi:unnamed protein product, partial [Phaeothamnion confervicola]
PSSIGGVAGQALDSVRRAVKAGEKRLQVDILLPGLNPKLENSAPYSPALLLSLLREVLSAFDDCASVKVLFSSAGDAAMAQKAYSDAAWPLNTNVRFGGCIRTAVGPADDAVLIVSPRNSVGDPVILEVEAVVAAAPHAAVLLFNPDLGEKVALGIRERDRRNSFLGTFRQVFYFRNLFFLRRPDLVPLEKGALMRRYDEDWSVWVTDDD